MFVWHVILINQCFNQHDKTILIFLYGRKNKDECGIFIEPPEILEDSSVDQTVWFELPSGGYIEGFSQL